MRLVVDGVTQHVRGVHDRLGPAGDTCAELEWVQSMVSRSMFVACTIASAPPATPAPS
jgi:hypothetical protein